MATCYLCEVELSVSEANWCNQCAFEHTGYYADETDIDDGYADDIDDGISCIDDEPIIDEPDGEEIPF